MVKVGVVGAGYLGRFHIEKFLKNPDCELVGIVDSSPMVREELKGRYNVPVYADYRELLSKVQAVSIVVPTKYHYEVASFFIEHNVHTFIEKPVTETLEQCRKLKSLVKDGVKVQVGHIERFNPAFKFLQSHCERPLSVTIRRKAPFTERGTDVDIVFDLMIHDIDLVLSLFKTNSLDIERVSGAKLLTDKYDYMTVFCNVGGIPVSLEASRVSMIKERTVTILTEGALYEGDFIKQEVFYKTKEGDNLIKSEIQDILYEELSNFIRAIKDNLSVEVSLEDGERALCQAYKILSFCEKS